MVPFLQQSSYFGYSSEIVTFVSMRQLIKSHKWLFVLLSLTLVLGSCNKKAYCPDIKKAGAADRSEFDEDGNPSKKSRKANVKKGGNGLVKKKTPKAMHKRNKRKKRK